MLVKMSVKEKPNKSEEKKSETKSIKTDDWLDNYNLKESVKPKTSNDNKKVSTTETSLEEISQVQKPEMTIEKVDEVKINLDLFIKSLPSWLSKPWMYVKPNLDTQLSSWLDSWENLILQYARILKIHVVNITETKNVYPFTNTNNGKSLAEDNLKLIIDDMATKNLAKWLDSNHILVRIYYKTDFEWSEIIMEFMMKSGRAVEVITIYEMQNFNQEWSSLPKEELVGILDLLVERNQAKWVGEEKDAISFII